ncbi:hypothetical protein JOD67_005362 [Tenggerimyces flavus]|nr:hypothetical protein [Tenggerimyces flavus]
MEWGHSMTAKTVPRSCAVCGNVADPSASVIILFVGTQKQKTFQLCAGHGETATMGRLRQIARGAAPAWTDDTDQRKWRGDTARSGAKRRTLPRVVKSVVSGGLLGLGKRR